MRPNVITLLVAAIAAAPIPAAHAGDPAQQVVAFRAEAKVTLDAAGHPLSIEPSGDLPAPMREFIRQRVATWRFSPPEQGGVTGPATTYLRLGACAIPQPDGNYRMAVDLKGNGPLYANGPMMMPPAYPKTALIRKIGATAIVTLVVGVDGRATVENIEYKDRANHRADGIDAALHDWVEGMRYEPEQLAGHPVRTRSTVPVVFSIAGRDFSRDKYREALHETAARSEECRLAAGGGEPEGLQAVAVDSPVRIDPAG